MRDQGICQPPTRRRADHPGALAPHLGAARCPAGDNRIAVGHGYGVVVGGIELAAIHSAAARCEPPDQGDAPSAAPMLARAIQIVLCAGALFRLDDRAGRIPPGRPIDRPAGLIAPSRLVKFISGCLAGGGRAQPRRSAALWPDFSFFTLSNRKGLDGSSSYRSFIR
jgi:hypothetical protein